MTFESYELSQTFGYPKIQLLLPTGRAWVLDTSSNSQCKLGKLDPSAMPGAAGLEIKSKNGICGRSAEYLLPVKASSLELTLPPIDNDLHELELQYAVPLGSFNATLNFGVAGGIIMPWGPNFQNMTTPIIDRFFMGGHTSLLGNMKGPSALVGFRTRGVGPSEPRQPPHNTQISQGPQPEERPHSKDTLGGDLAVSGFADLSFDLPVRAWKGWGIHAHTFICAGNLIPLTGNVPTFSPKTLLNSFRVSCGAGLVFPTKLFRLEVKYCYVLKKQAEDRVKRGIQVSLNSPQ